MTEPTKHTIQDETGVVNYIMLRRIYDVLIRMYAEMNEEDAKFLMSLHEEGIFFSPDPTMKVGRDDRGR